MKKALCVSKGLLEWESGNAEHGCSNAVMPWMAINGDLLVMRRKFKAKKAIR
ncbi:hypothetical protein AADZ86_18900 [Colwelliaceae bacterium BS250]